MARRTIDEETKARACEMLREGQSVTEVARETGVSRPTLYKWAASLEIETQRGGGRPAFDHTAIAEMMQTHEVEEVCEAFGCSKSTAYAAWAAEYKDEDAEADE